MREKIYEALMISSRVVTECQGLTERIAHAIDLICNSFAQGGHLFLFGNGGSAAEAQHIAAEFVNRFKIERPPLPAIALSTDTSVLTSIANDYSYDEIFSKQIKALGRQGDVAWGFTTSGGSPNVIAALKTARAMGISCLAMTGGQPTEIRDIADVHLAVPSTDTARVQEAHLVMSHLICELVDYQLFQRHGEMAAS